MVQVGDLLPDVSAEEAERWLKVWHGGRDGYVVLTKISAAGHHVVWSRAAPADQFAQLFESDDAQDGIARLCTDKGGNWNVYVSCSTHREDPTGQGGTRRGGKQTIDAVHGVWLDLDVKDEAFNDSAEADEFIRGLPIRPTIVANSGSGGRHVYWRFTEPVSRTEGETLCTAWWAYSQERAGSTYIDKVTTPDRIMRLPGTIRWPKKAGEDMHKVELLWDQGPLLDRRELENVAGSAYQRFESKIHDIRVSDGSYSSHIRATLEELAELHKGDFWDQALAVASFEDQFNETMRWDDILIPAGWRHVGKDNEGRRHWARPGQDGKSAHTDYPQSPHVMNLFSNAPDTGLSMLQTAGVPLTKFKVYAQIYYQGDQLRAIRSILSRGVQ